VGYRDELEAAKTRIAQLERQLEAARDRTARDARVRELEAKVAGLERRLAELTAAPSGLEAWMRYFSGPLAGAALYGLAFALVVSDADGAAWGACNAALLAMVFVLLLTGAPRAPSPWPWLASSLVTLAIPIVWGWGWWEPGYDELSRFARRRSFVFFWYAPIVGAAWTLVIGLVLRVGETRTLRRLGETPDPG
jgi:hypothetical protein